MTSLVGQQFGRYRTESLIGVGGMGAVYKALDLQLDRPVAIKFIDRRLAEQETFRARLAAEAKTVAKLDHPSIVRVYELGDDGSELFLVMEYIGGGSLRDHLVRLQSRKRFLPVDQALQIGQQVAVALDYAHSQGVFHRDVKPGNVILKQLQQREPQAEYPFKAVLTDFGLAALPVGDPSSGRRETWGTPSYMSPEQCVGKDPDARSDVYSLGVVLYELLTGQLPFSFGSLSEAIAVHTRGIAPKPATGLRGDLPAVVGEILDRSLAKDPQKRYDSCREMADSISDAIEVARKANLGATGGSGFQLRISADNYDDQVVALEGPKVTIGRAEKNDVVLDGDDVSRVHARLSWVDGGWQLVDTGGWHGTWLEGKRLASDQPVALQLNSQIRIGRYQLRLEEVQSEAGQSAVPPTRPGSVGLLEIALASEQLTINPGRSAELWVEIANLGTIADRVSLRVHGVPLEWVQLPPTHTQVGPNQRVKIPVIWRIPRKVTVPVGRQRFRIELLSTRYPEISPAVNGTLRIEKFEALRVSMNPKELDLPGAVRVEIYNRGNSLAEIRAVGWDAQDAIRFESERDRIALAVGGSAVVKVKLKARKRPLLGAPERINFSMVVGSRTGSRQVLAGRAVNRARFQVGHIYAAVFAAVFLCVMLMLLLVFSFSRTDSAVASTAQPGVGTAVGALASPTVMQTAPGANQGTATATATATIVADPDSDGDGLGDTQEQSIGTNPNSADTDADGLSDGEEVLTRSTSPVNRDTDGDILFDGDEVNLYGTSPLLADTDGDGSADGIEIASATDPLNPLDPLPTATPTLVLPTNTPTPVPPTNTPTATPTNTPTATATATSTPTATPTATASSTPTPSATPPAPDEYGISCSSILPVLDGKISPDEWIGAPTIEFSAGPESAWSVSGHMTWVTDQLLAGFVIEEGQAAESDGLALYIDSDGSGGIPGTTDRAFRIARNGALSTGTAEGALVTGETWLWTDVNNNWVAATGSTQDGQWTVEIRINAALELPMLLAGEPFGLMIGIGEEGSQGVWPIEAQSADASGWQAVNNQLCN